MHEVAKICGTTHGNSESRPIQRDRVPGEVIRVHATDQNGCIPIGDIDGGKAAGRESSPVCFRRDINNPVTDCELPAADRRGECALLHHRRPAEIKCREMVSGVHHVEMIAFDR